MKISKLETKQTNFIKDKFKSKLKKIKLHKNKTDTKEPKIKYFNTVSLEKLY